MPRTDGYVTYLLELLQPVGPLQARGMFGGWGIYYLGRMFGLVTGGQLYLKVDDATREDFRAAGGRPFIYEARGKRMETSYWTPPADATDDARELLPWARRAVEAAERFAARKRAPAKKPAAAKKAAPARKAAGKKAPAGMKRSGASGKKRAARGRRD